MSAQIRDLTLDDAKLMVVKRIAQHMAALVTNQVSSHDESMKLFGLGWALGICFEEFTGNSAKVRKPSELLKWAFDLPAPAARRVV